MNHNPNRGGSRKDKRMNAITKTTSVAVLIAIGLALAAGRLLDSAPLSAEVPAPTYRSPQAVAFSPDGQTLAVADRTAGALALIEVASGKVTRQAAGLGEPFALGWSGDGRTVWVSDYAGAALRAVDAATGKADRSIAVGPQPTGLAVAARAGLVVVCNSADATVGLIDLSTGQEKARVEVVRYPFDVALTPDERQAVVTNLLPLGDATEAKTAACVSVIDLGSAKKVADIALPPGSTNCRQVAVAPDGRWAYTVHTLGKTMLPTTQLERGWVNTNALSIVDLEKRELLATVLLDRLTQGAADPWSVALSSDGKTAWISIAGMHQVVRIDLAGLQERLGTGKSDATRPNQAPRAPAAGGDIWARIAADPARRADLAYDLSALHAAGLATWTPVDLLGPRGLDVAPDGRTLAVAGYFCGKVLLLEAAGERLRPRQVVALGPQPPADAVRRGEITFHNGARCFQGWLSCVTCHADGRVDGLNWDLLNDGLGNPKNSKSLLLAYRLEPVMSLGVRADMPTAVRAGFRFIQFHEPTDQEAADTVKYLESLKPQPSPFLEPGGKLSESARRGKAVFEGKAACGDCHTGPLLADQKLYDLGTTLGPDQGRKVVTPPLVELWRTAPYLHTGKAPTLHELFSKYNPADRHGKTSDLSRQELDDLVRFLLSL